MKKIAIGISLVCLAFFGTVLVQMLGVRTGLIFLGVFMVFVGLGGAIRLLFLNLILRGGKGPKNYLVKTYIEIAVLSVITLALVLLVFKYLGFY